MDSILDFVPAMIWYKDADNRILRVNKTAAESIGLPPQEIEGFSTYDIYPEEAKKYHEDDLTVIRSGKPKLGIVEHLRTKSGEKRWVRTDKIPYRDEQGKIIGVIVFAIDITDQKQAEENLEKSLSIFKATVESIADGILVVDRDEKIVTFNRKFQEMWNIPDSIMGSKDDQKAIEFVLSQLKEPESFVAKVRELYNQPDSESYDILKFKDGRTFERYSKPHKVGQKSIGRVWSFRDVTEQNKSSEALAEQAWELIRSNADLEQFASVASHDLKEPLRTVSNYLQLLESKYADKIDSEGRRLIQKAVGGARRMNALIEDLLIYSRVGRPDEDMKDFESDKVLQHALENLKPYLDESGAAVEHGPLPKVTYVETELLQIFQNLIGNAVKFRGGKKPVVRVNSASGNGEWIFSVSDNGIGIEPEFRQKIFMIFTRLHGRDKYEGTGIGLALCKKIVESRGGRVYMDSEPGRGSTFYFTIPKGGNQT